ncbi:BrnA antitoxin family protein [Avibacterium avium]|uniref:BrnA antitoxin family protein n=1 Tax=Avibacterium avium TaxID=751 RepID=UPI003BF7DE67
MKLNAKKEAKIAETPLTDEQLEQFKPIEQVLPAEQLNMLLNHQAQQKRRGKQKAATKQATTIRLSPLVLEKFRATGKGWQSRINEVLLKYVEQM